MKVKVKSLSRVWRFVTQWTVAYQPPLSMGSSRQEYWSGLPFPSPGDLPNPGIEPRSPALQADALPSWATREACISTGGSVPPHCHQCLSVFIFSHFCRCMLVSHWLYCVFHERKATSVLFVAMLCYAMLSHFSRVRLCVTPQTAAHQASPSLGFSRQEHWSGLPFPSPMHESEKRKWSRSVVSDS